MIKPTEPTSLPGAIWFVIVSALVGGVIYGILTAFFTNRIIEFILVVFFFGFSFITAEVSKSFGFRNPILFLFFAICYAVPFFYGNTVAWTGALSNTFSILPSSINENIRNLDKDGIKVERKQGKGRGAPVKVVTITGGASAALKIEIVLLSLFSLIGAFSPYKSPYCKNCKKYLIVSKSKPLQMRNSSVGDIKFLIGLPYADANDKSPIEIQCEYCITCDKHSRISVTYGTQKNKKSLLKKKEISKDQINSLMKMYEQQERII